MGTGAVAQEDAILLVHITFLNLNLDYKHLLFTEDIPSALGVFMREVVV